MSDTINVTYKFIDGAHFFVSNDKMAEGLCVAHADLKVAFEEVANQLNVLFEHNHGQKTCFKPVVPFEDFRTAVEAFTLLTKGINQAGRMMPSSIQPWMHDKPGARQ